MNTIRNFLIALWYLAIPTAAVVGATVGGVNGYKALSDPAGTWTDVVTYGGGPAAGGLIGAILLGVLHWVPHKLPKAGSVQPVPNPDDVPEKPQPQYADAPAETRIEIHEKDVDVVCVLRGDAAKDSEGRQKIGDVASHFAGGGK